MRVLIFLFNFLIVFTSQSQNEIPLGSWRTHFSYNTVKQVIPAKNRVYAVAENGLFYFDTEDNSVSTINKLSGLQDDVISTIAYNDPKDQLLIGYESGNFDVIDGNEIVTFDFVSESQVIGSKRINHILVENNLAFIATDYGLLRFDLSTLELKEVYRELGDDARQIRINQTAVLGDSLFLATDVGVIASDYINGTNLFDPSNWRRYNSDEGINQINTPFIINHENRILAFQNGIGISSYNSQKWTTLPILSSENFISVNNGDDLLIVANNRVFKITVQNGLEEQNISEVNFINDALSYNSVLWLADQTNGLVSDIGGVFESIKPSGPFSNQLFRFFYNRSSVFGLPGGFTNSRQAANDSSGYYQFSNGQWANFNQFNGTLPVFDDITDLATFNNGSLMYFSSFKNGILRKEADGTFVRFDSTNAPLSSAGTGNLRITALEASREGLWVANFGAPQALHLFNEEWNSFILPNSALLDMTNTQDFLWCTIDPQSGGGILVIDKATMESRFLNDIDGNGGLPSDNVNALAEDKDGLIWVGTNSGVAYFSRVSNITESSINAIIPIFENRLLLRDEVITAIEIDPGNRKWIGTERGLWLFDESADSQLQFFNIENSPLPSNEIIAIEVLEETGEVFIATSNGIVSYRADASTPTLAHNDVKIFPNPVTRDFNGLIGISGLVAEANIKITDASGKLIWETRSAGGTATWDANDYNGRRASTGVYFVFSSTEDGEETFIGKIAVIN